MRFAIFCVSIEDECKNRTLKFKKQVILLTKRKNIQNIFVFTNEELMNYLQANAKVCENLLNESYDKRFSPSSFIAERGNEYEVGFYDQGYLEVEKNQIVDNSQSWNCLIGTQIMI